MKKIFLIWVILETCVLIVSAEVYKDTLNMRFGLIDGKVSVIKYFCSDSALIDISIPDSIPFGTNNFPVTAIYSKAFEYCTTLSSIILPQSLESIMSEAFAYCSSLDSIYITSAISEIGFSPFKCCDLSHIVVDDNNPFFDNRGNCNAIIRTHDNCLILGCKTSEIPESVVEIYEFAFDGCDIELVDLPSSLKKIGSMAFINCDKLKRIICRAVEPPITDHTLFLHTVPFTLFVPESCIDTYRSNYCWNSIKETIPDTSWVDRLWFDVNIQKFYRMETTPIEIKSISELYDISDMLDNPQE